MCRPFSLSFLKRKLSVTLFLFLKGVWHEILDFRFCSWIGFPWSPLVSTGALYDFLKKILCDIRNFVFIAGVNDTDNKLFTHFNDTSNKLSLVSLLPAINHCRCRWHRWLGLVPDFHRFQDTYNNNKQQRQHVNKIWKNFLIQKFFSLITGVVDTGDEPLLSNISANFRKNSKWPQWNTLLRSQELKSKISCHTPFYT